MGFRSWHLFVSLLYCVFYPTPHLLMWYDTMYAMLVVCHVSTEPWIVFVERVAAVYV